MMVPRYTICANKKLLLLGLIGSFFIHTVISEPATIRPSYENPISPGGVTNDLGVIEFPDGKTLATNTVCYGVASGVGGLNLHTNNYASIAEASARFYISEMQVGAPCGAVVANYGLGDELLPPEGALAGANPIFEADNVLWLDYADKLLAVDGGAVIVKWEMEGNPVTTNTMTYVVSPTPTERPVRLYWTDDENGKPLQNAGPTIQFGQNYRVDLYPSSAVSINTNDFQWSYSGTDSPPPNDVWLDGSMLHAKKGAKGKFLLTYSRIDEFGLRQHLGHEVVEVLEPRSELLHARVGDRLKPVKRQYKINDLFCTISRGATDPTGENPSDVFVYKHSQGPKNGWVWAVKETEAAWQIEIYWKAKEKLDVIWPFEVDMYDVSWGTDLQEYVRGDLLAEDLEARNLEPSVLIPPELSVEVMPYQTRTGSTGGSDTFAFSEEGKLYTDDFGTFLLKYSTEDTVWFEPIEAVSHTENPGSFSSRPIASRLTPLDDSGAYTNWPGYCYTPTGTAYNPHYYRYPSAYQDPQDIGSDLFGVNRGCLEVWWANASKYWTLTDALDDEVKLPKPIFFPSLVNTYTNVWPESADQIVVASGKGTLGMSMATNQTDLLAVEGSGFTITNTPSVGNWASNDSFTIEFRALVDGADGTFVQQEAQQAFWEFGFTNGALKLACRTSTTTNSISGLGMLATNTWNHIALARDASGSISCYLNGGRVYRESTPIDLKVDGMFQVGAFEGQLDEFRVWSYARSADEIQHKMRLPLNGDEIGLEYYASFNADEESVDYDSSMRQPGGVPAIRSSLSLVGAAPQIYIQGDPSQHGYNPNEEHALQLGDNVYALRNSLNKTNETDYTSLPFVLVEYTDPVGMPSMAIYAVQFTNELYELEQFLDAGLMIQAPAPLNLMVPTWMPDNTFQSKALIPFKDRTGRFWAHQAGNSGGSTNSVAQLYYPSQKSFWYPSDSKKAEGAPVALSGRSLDRPTDFNYVISWPEDVPGLCIGDTLTNPRNGLPAIRGQLSVNVFYQQSMACSGTNFPSVKLIDPTQPLKAPMEKIPEGMKIYRDPKTGHTFFSELPPALRDRMFWNSTADKEERFQLKGKYVERTDGYNYLLLNILSQSNRVNTLNSEIVTGQDLVWSNAVDALPAVMASVPDDETPVDSYALSTVGLGSGYVTLIFNDSENREMVDPSENVQMKVIKVEPELFQGRLDTLLSPNPLDRQITLKYTADFAGQPDLFEFDWDYAEPKNGSAPKTNSPGWLPFARSEGLHYTMVGDAGVFGLSDKYLRCRYRALSHDVISVVGTNWSAWTDPQLCEGWIKRAMKEINPFEQRIRDYMNYETDTSLSMIQQAGQPYSGDVPLNYGALDDYGLIPIYETIYLQSLGLCKNNEVSGALSLALMMVSGRLSDFYTMLGNEAYADALNPTVTLGSDDPVSVSEVSSIFCFQNQLPDLLSEELCLLRGRDNSMNPPVENHPIYNRLVPNFTADIIGGEVAYALNYGIKDIENHKLEGMPDGSIDEYDALKLYPQGHGDAWGHYLKAMKYYYGIMHADDFHWYPQVEGLLVGDVEVTISYLHEKKFVTAAAAKARAGLDILNKTWRQHYTDGVPENGDLLYDSNTNRCWGVSEWASRVGQGTYFDWLAANSLLPEYSAPTNSGIRVIDRVSTPELAELTEFGSRIQQQLDAVDAGMNPLGLAQHVVPFDISPVGIDAGETHFEQIYERAAKALQNAAEIFDRVQTCNQALRDQNEAREFDLTVADEEAELTRRLIEIYGYPYSNDKGPGSLYDDDYLGPDLVHYNYIEIPDIDGRYEYEGEELLIPLEHVELLGVTRREVKLVENTQGTLGAAKTVFNDWLGAAEILLTDIVSWEDAKVEVVIRWLGLDVDISLEEFMAMLQVPEVNWPEWSALWPEIHEPTISWPQMSLPDLALAVGLDLPNLSFADLLDLLGIDISVVGPTVSVPGFDPSAISDAFQSDSTILVDVPITRYSTNMVPFYVGAGGVLMKPVGYDGHRRAEGKIQIALSQYVEALRNVKANREHIHIAAAGVRTEEELCRNAVNAKINSYNETMTLENRKYAYEQLNAGLKKVVEVLNSAESSADKAADASAEAVPTSVGFSTDAGAPVRGGIKAASIAANVFSTIGQVAATGTILVNDLYISKLKKDLEILAASSEINTVARDSVRSVNNALTTYQNVFTDFEASLQAAETARMEYMRAIAEGDGLQVERERMRMNHAANLNAKRYRNMAYRIFRNDELNRYSEAFDQAARYCYLAAKAYDYETGLLQSESSQTAGRDFMEDIVTARTIGRMTRGAGNSPDVPLAGGPVGDPGLADVLARMKANWDVLDGRLSFNNPQTETGRFSLRSELFRIKPSKIGGEKSDENWRETLEKHRVDNLLELDEFQRHCLPFTPAELEEPAIVIPFSTDINFRNNFFGHDLAGGDNAYDSTHFATKIRSAGVWFSNFDNAFEGGVANQPRVYLIPVGVDRMRVPSVDMDEIRNFQVVDQALPVPYPFNEQDWDSPDWSVLKDMLGNELYNIRRYPSMRAYHDSGDFNATEVVNNSRLIGRSVWNTQWLLIIPGGTLLNDGDEGLDRFIHGREVYPGVRDENGVEDIKIFFQTYSFSGN